MQIGGSSGGLSVSFSAVRNAAQSLASATVEDIDFDATEYDTHDYFNTTTHQFLPLTEGWYFISAAIAVDDLTDADTFYARLLKNGSVVNKSQMQTGNTGDVGAPVSKTIYLNGSTDYVTVQAYQNSGVAKDVLTGTYTSIQGFIVKLGA